MLGTAFAPLPGLFCGDENPAWGRDGLTTTRESGDRAKAWSGICSLHFMALPWLGRSRSSGLSWRCPPFVYSCVTSLPCAVSGQTSPAPQTPSRLPGADGDEDFLQTPSPPGSAA